MLHQLILRMAKVMHSWPNLCYRCLLFSELQ